ncbi:hypothetical protein Tco_0404506 [Tanacetum coccineum]
MSSSSTVTYTSVYIDSEPWRFQWISDDESEAPQSSRQAPPSLECMPGPEHPPSQDYVPCPEEPEQAPLSPEYVPKLDYPEYLVPSDAEDDPEEDPADYPANRGDDNESSGDDTDDKDEEASEDEDDDEEEDHLALADFFDVAAIDLIPSPLLPLPSPPTHTSPTYAEAPLGYRAAGIQLRAASPPLLLPSTDRRDDIPEADLPPRKRLCLTAPTPRFKLGEKVGYGIEDVWDDMVRDMEEREPTTVEGLSQRVTDLSTTLARETHEIYVRLEDAQDDRALQRGRVNMFFRDRRFHRHTTMLLKSEARHAREAWSRSMNCSKAVHAELQAYQVQVQTHEIQIQRRDTRIGSLETLVTTLVAQTSLLKTQLTIALGRIQTLEAKEPAHTDDPEDAGSSS